jgi:hypothetical protein
MSSLLLILVFVSCLSQSVEAADGPSGKSLRNDVSSNLMGNWQCRGPTGNVSLVFESGNRLVFGGEPSTYTLVRGAVRILNDGVPEDYRYSLKGDSLSFVSPENERYQCKRVGGAATGTPGSLVGDQSLMRWFAGSYYHFMGSTERRVVLCPDGRFRGGRESSYSGKFSEGGGQTGAWGTASQSAYGGKWTLRGDQRQGTITLVYSGGGKEEVSYRAGRERGCFHFNGTLFCYEGAGDCR